MGEEEAGAGSGGGFTEAQKELLTSRQAMRAWQQQAAGAREQLTHTQRELQILRDSSSWRLTLPLRSVARALRSLRGIGGADLVSLPRFMMRRGALKKWLRSLKAVRVVRSSDLFDAPWYLKTYPEVAKSRLDPARHYVMVGAALGFQPSARFDSRWYLEQYPDVARAQVNPLQHYILHGKETGRHPRPSQRQVSRKKVQARSGNTAGLARIEQSNAWRLNHLKVFEQEVADYQSARQQRATQALRVAVYCAAIGPDALVLQPAVINPHFDYWCFTDCEQVDVGIWQFAPLPWQAANDERALRYVKTHPHQLLPDYDVVIWVDPGIQLHGTLEETLQSFVASEKPLGALANQSWSSLYEEADYCQSQYPGEAALIREQIAALESAGFAHDDLIDPAWLFVDLRHRSVPGLLSAWWRSIERYSFCEQLSLNPVLFEAGQHWHRLADGDSGLSDQYCLAQAPAAVQRATTKALEAALNRPRLEPGAVSFSSHRDQALAMVKGKQIDIVFYAGRQHLHPGRCLESVAAAVPGSDIRLIVIDHDCADAQAKQLQAFCRDLPAAEILDCSHVSGRTAALNCGLSAATGELVIVLEAQVSVAPDWVLKLAHALHTTPGAGLVGPLTNAAATQCVIDVSPAQRHTGLNVLPAGLDVEQLDRHCEQWAEYNVPARTATLGGFCLGISREVLNGIGGFDEQLFPDGVRHDDDFCLRAADAGYGVLIATNTFVFQRLSPAQATRLPTQRLVDAEQALASVHGVARVARLAPSLSRHVQINRVRQLVKVLDRCRRADLPTVSVLPGISGRGMPGSSAYIRLVLPLALPAVTSLADIDLLGYWDRKLPVPGSAKIVYLQRDIVDVSIEHLESWSRAWKDAGGQIFFDIDDDLFDTEGLMERTRARIEKAHETQARIRSIIECTDVVTVSTPELAQRLQPISENIVVMPNDLDSQLWGLPAFARCETPAHPDGIIRIGYIGTATHQQDLELIVAAVQRLSEHYGDRIQLEVVGAFEGREVLFGRALDLQGASEYPAFVDWAVSHVNWDIGLIPLVDDTFNRSKSDLKFTEYAALGMAIVCSDVPSYRSVARHEQNSLVVPNNEQAWYEAVSRLVEDAVLRRRLALAAHQYVCEERTLQANQSRVVDLLKRAL